MFLLLQQLGNLLIKLLLKVAEALYLKDLRQKKRESHSLIIIISNTFMHNFSF